MEQPLEESHGDYATNVAMALAGILKKSPLEIAQDIVKNLISLTFWKVLMPLHQDSLILNLKMIFFIKELNKILIKKKVMENLII